MQAQPPIRIETSGSAFAAADHAARSTEQASFRAATRDSWPRTMLRVRLLTVPKAAVLLLGTCLIATATGRRFAFQKRTGSFQFDACLDALLDCLGVSVSHPGKTQDMQRPGMSVRLVIGARYRAAAGRAARSFIPAPAG